MIFYVFGNSQFSPLPQVNTYILIDWLITEDILKSRFKGNENNFETQYAHCLIMFTPFVPYRK